MMRKTYHELTWLLRVVLLLCALPAMAAPLQVEAMRVAYGEGWQRGDAAEEAELDSFVLMQPGLHLYLPRTPVVLKVEAERFREQLQAGWRSQFGAAAWLGEDRFAGRTWLLCRRPSQEGTETVFHFVSVIAGRAYTLLWVQDGIGQALSEPAREVMETIVFDAPATTSGWRRIHQGWRMASPAEQDGGLQADLERMGGEGRFTGYGMQQEAFGLAWHLEGELRTGSGEPMRAMQAFSLNRRLSWEALPEQLSPAGSLDVRLALEAEGRSPVQPERPGARVELRLLCVDQSRLQSLRQRTGRDWLLAQDNRCPYTAATSDGLFELEGGGAAPLHRQLSLPLPGVPEPQPDGAVPVLLLSIQPVAADQPTLGSGLIGQTVAYYLYAPAQLQWP